MRYLEIIARAVGNQLGVRVEVSSTAGTACTDGRKITLPQLAAVASDEEAELFEGFLDHEAFHCRYTDFSVQPQTPLLMGLANIMEDVRIERLGYALYPGTRRNIARLFGHLLRLGEMRGPQPGSSGIEALLNWLICVLRAEELGQQALAELARQWDQRARQHLGPQADRVLAEARAGTQAPDTAGVLTAAQRIVTLLQQAQQAAQAPQPGLEGKSQNQSKSGGPGQGQGKHRRRASATPGPDTTGQPGVRQGDEDPAPASSAPGQAKPQAAAGGQEAGAGHGDPQALAQMLSATAQDVQHSDLGRLLEQHLPIGSQAPNRREQVRIHMRVGGSYGVELRQEARAVTLQLQNRMESFLEAQSHTQRYAGLSGRKLQGRRLAAVRTGTLRVFERVEEGEALDTALILLIDQSASMKVLGRNDLYACYAGLALGDVLAHLDVPFAVAGFNDGVTCFKRFDDRWLRQESPIPAAAVGGTRMAAAVSWAVGQVLPRRESRKVVLVATDGHPSSWDELQAVVLEARRYGVETRFVLIGQLDPDHFQQKLAVPVHVGAAAEPSRLPPAIMEAMAKGLA